jgi:hypothetical protein
MQKEGDTKTFAQILLQNAPNRALTIARDRTIVELADPPGRSWRLGFACVLWFIGILYRNGFRDFRHWNQCWRGALQLSTLIACTGLLVHSALDFNLQVPGNAALFYVFCALATSLSPKAEQMTKHSLPARAETATPAA